MLKESSQVPNNSALGPLYHSTWDFQNISVPETAVLISLQKLALKNEKPLYFCVSCENPFRSDSATNQKEE